jgi:hypothetical protein
MLDNTNFTQYKKIKALLALNESNIDLEKVMAIDICSVVFGYNISWFKAVASYFLSTDINKIVNGLNSSKVLFIDSNKRVELSAFLKLVMNNVHDKHHVHFESYQINPFIDIPMAISSMNFVKKAVGDQVSFKNLLFLSSRLSFYRRIARELQKKSDQRKLACQKLVALHCQYSLEAMLTQFCKNKGMQTFTLTHGISYTTHRQVTPVDAINGENITSEKILVWGESNKNELIQNYNISPDRISAAGNLLYPQKEIIVKQTFQQGIILLGRKLYHQGNIEILKLAQAISLKKNIAFSVRLHPSLSISYYTRLCKKLNITITDSKLNLKKMFSSGMYDFALVNNSTTYYEAMYYNMICFRYEPDENEQYEGLDDKFSDLPSLSSKIDFFKRSDYEILSKKISQLLVQNLGMGVNRYKEILNT